MEQFGNIKLYNGDCMEYMKTIPDNSIDLIITDPPYGVTACGWDNVIPFEPMWKQLKRLIKDNGAILLFGTEPFSSSLRMSNIKNYKYDWYWIKSKPNGFQHAKNKPMTKVETISVFSLSPMGHATLLGKNRMNYNPQGIIPNGMKKVLKSTHGATFGGKNKISGRPNQVGKEYLSYTNFPSNVLEYNNIIGKKALHPTQKPVDLLEYLIKTYTNENDTVLDFTMGSGSTGVAAVNLNRKFIGIEIDEQYFNISKSRIETTAIAKRN
jgi:DNA modification methylase